MHFLTGFRRRYHRAPEYFPEAAVPSGYHTSSGIGDGFVRLSERVAREYPDTPLTPELIHRAMGVESLDTTPDLWASLRSD